MSDNNQPLSGNTITPLQRVSLNSALTNLVLDSDLGNSSLIVRTGSIPSFYIDKFSNVGINTTTPGAQFEIASNNGSCMRLRYGSSTSSFTNIFMTSSGNLSINPNTSGSEINTTASLNISNHNGASIGLKLNGVLVAATAAQLNYTAVVAGTASPSKALVLNSDSSISGITSITATNLTGTLQTPEQPKITSVGTLSSLTVSGNLTVSGALNLTGGGNIGDSIAYLSGITVGSASPSKALVVSPDSNITGINNVGLTTITIGSHTLTSKELGFLTGFTEGAATPLKALVLNGSGIITGISALSATQLSGTLQTPAQPNITSIGTLTSLSIGSSTIGVTEAGYLAGVIAGEASTGKVLVLNGAGVVSGITTLSASNLSGTLLTATQTGITAVGTLSSLNVSGNTVISSTTDASGSSSGGALTVSGGIAVAKNAFVGGNLTVTGSLFVNGTTTSVNSNSISIQDNTLTLNASPVGPVDSGIIVNRYQTANDASTGSVVTDAPSITTTSSSSTMTTIVLSTGSSVDNYYQGWWIKSGTQVRKVQSYVGATKTITLESALTTAITNGSSVSLFNRTYASMVWNESNKQFLSAYTATDSTSALTIIDNADFKAANITSSGSLTVLDPTDSTSVSSGSLVISGGVGVAKKLYVGSGIFGTIQTGAQPNITSVGTLSSLSVTNGITASTLTGTLQTVSQPNITSVGTLTSLAVASANSNALTITNSSPSGLSNLKFIGDSYSCEMGIRGTTALNPSTFYLYYNNAFRLIMDTSGNICVGASTFAYKLNVGGSFNATSINVGGTTLATSLIAGTLTAGQAVGDKVLSVNTARDVSNINSLTAAKLTGEIQTADQPKITSVGALTSLTIGSATISATDASYLNGITAGTASASKAVILGSSREISNLGALSSVIVNDTTELVSMQSWTNDLATDMVAKLEMSNVAPRFGTTSNHKMRFMSNGTNAMFLQPSGNVSIGVDSDSYKLDIGGSFNATSYYLNGSSLDFSTLSYITGVSEGTAAPRKALVLSPTSTITGIASLTTTSITLGTTALTETNASYISGIQAGTASGGKALILSGPKNIEGIRSLSAEILIVNGLDVYSSISSSVYLTAITEGEAKASKALVLNGAKDITGINNIGTTTITLGPTNILGATEAGYLTTITAGNAANGKALVLSGAGAISGIASLTTSSLTIGSSTLGNTQAGFLTSVTAGTALASKALVLDSSRSITGIGSVGLSGMADLLSLTNNSASGYVAQSFVSDSMTLSVGVRGSTNVANPNTAYWYYNGAYRLLMNSSGDVSIGTASFGYKLNIGGSFNATSYFLNGSTLNFSGLSFITGVSAGTATNNKALILSETGTIGGITSLTTTSITLGTTNTLGATEAGYLTSITAGSAANGKALVLSGAGAISGISSLTTTTITLGTTTTLGTTEAGYLTSISAGTASASKAIVLDSNKGISGLGAVGLIGVSDILTLTNTTASAYVAQSFVSDSMTLAVGVRGSTNATNPNTAYMHFNGAYRLLINSSGEVSLGTNAAGYRLNVNGSTNSTSYFLNGAALDFTGLSYITGVSAGSATNGKALVLNGAGLVSGIATLGTTTIIVNGSSISAEAAFLSGASAGNAAINKVLVLNGAGAITGITSLSTTTLVLGAASLGATEAGYLTSNTIGSAVANKALVVDGAKSIDGINSITATTLKLGSTSLTTTEAAYLTSIGAGTASAGKAVVLDSSRNITNISSIGLTMDGSPITMTNTAATARTTIKFVNDTKTYEVGTAGSGNTSFPTGAFYLYDSTSTAIRFMVGSTGNVAIGATTANDRLNVNGTINATGYKIGNTAVDLTLLTGVTAGTATNGKALVLGGAGAISGITSLTTTSITLGTTNTLGATEAGYLTSITAGTATASKALVLGSSRQISNVGAISTVISNDTNNLAEYQSWTNDLATDMVVKLEMSNVAPRFGTTSNHKMRFMAYDVNALFIQPSGNVSIGVDSDAYKLNVAGTINATQILVNGSPISSSSPYTTGITEGVATASKALVLDSSKNISGINSLSTSDIITSGSVSSVGGIDWVTRSSSADNSWFSVCWAPELGLFVAVAGSGTGNRVMTSSDGITWTSRTSASDNEWRCVCWSPELKLFVAVTYTGTNRVMTSANGISWTSRAASVDNQWVSVCWSPELYLFVAVSNNGTNRIMTSPDGITWTSRTASADNDWRSICWSPKLKLFVVVGGAAAGVTTRAMTSPDGITWTNRTITVENTWQYVCWSEELTLFVAVAVSGTGNRVMTSSNGTTWTTRTSAADEAWRSVCWATELNLFVAVANTGVGNRVMTSSDGITWTLRTSSIDNSWLSVCWAPEIATLVAVATTGTGDRVMSSTHRNNSALNLLTNTQSHNTSKLGIEANVHMKYYGGLYGTHRWLNSTASKSENELMRLDSSGLMLSAGLMLKGRIGVNTTTPGALLDLGAISSDKSLALFNNLLTYYGFGASSSYLKLQSGGGHAFYTDSSSTSTGTELMRISPNGNVGIGTANPSHNLDIFNSISCSLRLRATDSTKQTVWTQSSTANYSLIYVEDTSLYLGALGGSSTAELGHGGQLSTSFNSGATYKTSFRTGNSFHNVYVDVSINNNTASIGTFSNHSCNYMTNNQNRMLIDTNGSIKRTGGSTSTSFDAGSDRRIKEDIVDADINLCYENVKRLKLKYYKWSDQYIEFNQQEDKHVLGWIAQEVEEIFPKSVSKSNQYGFSDFRSLNIDTINRSLYGCVTKIIQDKEALEVSNALLQSKVSDLEARLARLEAMLNNE